MFDRLLFWLREKARLLFGENTTVSASVSYSMENAIILWAQMYAVSYTHLTLPTILRV